MSSERAVEAAPHPQVGGEKLGPRPPAPGSRANPTLLALFERFFAAGAQHDAATAAAADATVAQLSSLEAVPADWSGSSRTERVTRGGLLDKAAVVLDMVRYLPGSTVPKDDLDSPLGHKPSLLTNLVYAAGAATGVVQGVAEFTLHALSSARHDDDNESSGSDDEAEAAEECAAIPPAQERGPSASGALERGDSALAVIAEADDDDGDDATDAFATPGAATPASSASYASLAPPTAPPAANGAALGAPAYAVVDGEAEPVAIAAATK